MVSFSENLDGFSLRLRVEAAPSVPNISKESREDGSGTCIKFTPTLPSGLPQEVGGTESLVQTVFSKDMS